MKKIWMDDLYRYTGETKISTLILQIFTNHEYRIVWLFRKAAHGRNPLYKVLYRTVSRKYGIDISPMTQIGPGFYMGHCYGITINSRAIIGSNVNIHKGATIGRTNRGKKKGAPIIGSCVYIGINSTVVGKIEIGDDVLIAPNSYVNFDVPSNSIVIGNPAIVIRKEGATNEYINRKVQ